MDLNLFPLLVAKQYRDDGISAAQLAEFTGGEKDLIGTCSYACVIGLELANSIKSV
jgi:hypothetical protein